MAGVVGECLLGWRNSVGNHHEAIECPDHVVGTVVAITVVYFGQDTGEQSAIWLVNDVELEIVVVLGDYQDGVNLKTR